MEENEKNIEQQIAERIQEKQKGKEFKDTSVVTYTRKYTSAFDIITSKDLDKIEQDNVIAYKLIEKSKIFPLYNVNELKEKGNSSGCAYLKVKLREALSSKPIDSKDAREVYVKTIEKLRSDLEPLLIFLDVKNYLDKFIDIEKMDLGKLPDEKENKSSYNYNLVSSSISGMSYSEKRKRTKYVEDIFGKKFINFCKANSDSSKKIFIEAMLYEASEGDEANQIEKIKTMRKNRLELSKKAVDEIQAMNSEEFFKYVSSRWRGIPNSLSKFKEDKYRGEPYFRERYKNEYEENLKKLDEPIEVNPIYKKRDNDWSWAETKDSKKEKKVDEEGKPIKPENIFQKLGIEEPKNLKRLPLDFIKRTGGLPVGDLSTKAVIENFGFKNIVYGNYVNDLESKEHTRHILGSMLDLVELCNINIKDINKLGGLDVNIGSTGCGAFSKASACYFPSLKAINITKTKGDGSIAHEWSHYLDNVLAELKEKKATNITHATDVTGEKPIKLKSERVTNLFIEFSNWLKNGGEERKIKTVFYPQSKFNYYLRGNTVDEAIQNIQQRYPIYSKYENSQLPDVYKYYGFIAYKLNNNNKIEVELTTKSTTYWVSSSMYSPYSYYTNPAELFARAFETWIEYRLTKLNRVNNYLTDIKSGMGLFANLIPRSEWFYPSGKELEWLDDWFERLFSAIRVDYDIKPFDWNTNERIDEYTEYKDTKQVKTDASVIVKENGETTIIDDDTEEFEKGYGFRMEKIKDDKGVSRLVRYLITDPYNRGKGMALGGEKSDIFIASLKNLSTEKSGYAVCDGFIDNKPNIVKKLENKKIEIAKKEAVEYYKNKNNNDMKTMSREPKKSNLESVKSEAISKYESNKENLSGHVVAIVKTGDDEYNFFFPTKDEYRVGDIQKDENGNEIKGFLISEIIDIGDSVEGKSNETIVERKLHEGDTVIDSDGIKYKVLRELQYNDRFNNYDVTVKEINNDDSISKEFIFSENSLTKIDSDEALKTEDSYTEQLYHVGDEVLYLDIEKGFTKGTIESAKYISEPNEWVEKAGWYYQIKEFGDVMLYEKNIKPLKKYSFQLSESGRTLPIDVIEFSKNKIYSTQDIISIDSEIGDNAIGVYSKYEGWKDKSDEMLVKFIENRKVIKPELTDYVLTEKQLKVITGRDDVSEITAKKDVENVYIYYAGELDRTLPISEVLLILEDIEKIEHEKHLKSENLLTDKPLPESKQRFSAIKEIPRSQITTMPELFQGRQTAYSEETVEKILSEGYDKSNEPIIVWFNSENEKYVVISGHSRWEASKRLYEKGDESLETMPVKEFIGDKEEAVSYAVLESNRASTSEGFLSDLNAVKKMMNDGYNKSEMAKYIKPDSYLEKLINYTYLNPNGQFVDYLSQPAKHSVPYLERNANWVGQLRKQFGSKLTNSHEKEIFDYFYKENKKGLFIKKEDFVNMINGRVMSLDWNENKPLNLKNAVYTSPLISPVKELIKQVDSEINEYNSDINKKRILIARAKEQGLNDLAVKFESEIEGINSKITLLVERKLKLESDSNTILKQVHHDLFNQPDLKVEAEMAKQEGEELANDKIKEAKEESKEYCGDLIDFTAKYGKKSFKVGELVNISGRPYKVSIIDQEGIEFVDYSKLKIKGENMKYAYNEIIDFFDKGFFVFDGYGKDDKALFDLLIHYTERCELSKHNVLALKETKEKTVNKIVDYAMALKESQIAIKELEKNLIEKEEKLSSEIETVKAEKEKIESEKNNIESEKSKVEAQNQILSNTVELQQKEIESNKLENEKIVSIAVKGRTKKQKAIEKEAMEKRKEIVVNMNNRLKQNLVEIDNKID